MRLKCSTGAVCVPANCLRSRLLILILRNRRSRSARRSTVPKGGTLSQTLRRKRATAQSKCRHFSVRKCRSTSKCFMTSSRTSVYLRLQSPISITKWSEGRNRRALRKSVSTIFAILTQQFLLVFSSLRASMIYY